MLSNYRVILAALSNNIQINFSVSEFLSMHSAVYLAAEHYYELVIVSKSLQSQGGSGTVGIYHVYEMEPLSILMQIKRFIIKVKKVISKPL